jgi:hypothetical protein
MRRRALFLATVLLWGPAASTQDSKPGEVARWMATDLGPVFSSTIQVREMVPKAIAVRVGEGPIAAAVCYDQDLGRVAGGWTGGFVLIDPGRDALLGNDRFAGELRFRSPELPGWAEPGDETDPRMGVRRKAGPLPHGRIRYAGIYFHGPRTVLSWTLGAARILEHPWAVAVDGAVVFTRSFRIRGLEKPQRVRLAVREKNGPDAALVGQAGDVRLASTDTTLAVDVPAGDSAFTVLVGPSAALPAAREASFPDPETLTKGGPRTWSETLTTKGKRGAGDGAFVIDTLVPPFDNPWKSILHFGGHDFFSDGTAAICTMEGDVWKVSGIDDALEAVRWQRIATGLYHPLGLKIVKDVIHVLCRDQIARLHDLNGDGQIDFHECFNNDCHVGTNSHEFATCLETDPSGALFYIKGTNEGQTIHDSSVLKVSADGRTLERFATGLRWPNGMGMSASGVLTAADQQGTWMPSSRLDWIEPGGFYGYLNSHHREKAPETYDGPLCWIPHGVDNSCGGQAWVESERWGPLQGKLLHLSYGKCEMFLVLHEQVAGKRQGGVVKFPLPPFESGAMRARFRPQDGQLYVSGLRGWQTSGARDGCFQRVRYTGAKFLLPVELNALNSGVRLSFLEPLGPSAAEADRWDVSRWNYLWSKEYGSPHFSVENPKKRGEDKLEVKRAVLSADGRSVLLEIDDMKPVMQMSITYSVKSADGRPVKGAVYHTIHALRD